MQKWKPASWREQRANVGAGLIQEVTFNDTMPNHVIFSNNGADILYMSVSAGVGTAIYDIIIPAYGVKLFSRLNGFKYCFLFNPSLAAIDCFIQSFEGDFNPAAVSQTSEIVSRAATGVLGTILVDSIITPVVLGVGAALIGKVDINEYPRFTPQVVVIGAGAEVIVKATAGYVSCIGVLPIDVVLRNGATDVWNGTYQAGIPIYCNTDIRLFSAGGGSACIGWR